jgi:hypothetical protein
MELEVIAPDFSVLCIKLLPLNKKNEMESNDVIFTKRKSLFFMCFY